MPDNDNDDLAEHTHHIDDNVMPLMRRVPKDAAAGHPSAHQLANQHVDLETMKEVQRLLSGDENNQQDAEPDPPKAS